MLASFRSGEWDQGFARANGGVSVPRLLSWPGILPAIAAYPREPKATTLHPLPASGRIGVYTRIVVVF